MIWVEKYKYFLVLFLLLLGALGGRYFLTTKTTGRTTLSPPKEPTLLPVKSEYIYESIASRLKSKGVSLFPIKDKVLSQIFPESKFWQFNDEEGNVLYLADGTDKIEHNVVNNEVLTDKMVALATTEADLDEDGEKELVAFTIVKFQDAALCCDQKRFLGIFKKIEKGRWKLIKEIELEVPYGGQHKGKIKALMINNLPIIQLEIEGNYHNGLESSTVEWYVLKNDQIKKIWQENIFYNTDNVGTYPKEAMNNYQAYFELEPSGHGRYPKIKLIKIYIKKHGRNLETPEQEEIYYLWNPNKERFESSNTSKVL
jgi:hypothetical protein